MNISTKLQGLLDQATRKSRYWLTDAVVNEDDISEAADDFFLENKPFLGRAGAKRLANDILVECGAQPVFPY